MQVSHTPNNSDQRHQSIDGIDLVDHRSATFRSRVLKPLFTTLGGLCCAASIIWLVLISICTIVCFTSQLPPLGKVIVVITSIAAVFTILLLLNGKWKYLLGIPSLLVAVWIVVVIWTTRDVTNYGSQIGKQVNLRMREIGLALSWYNDRWGHLPFPIRRDTKDQSAYWHDRNGEGKALYSWRVEILPLPRSWNASQSWKAAANRELFSHWLLYSYRLRQGDETGLPDTMAQAITGPGTAFGDSTRLPASLDDIPPDTIIVVETHSSGIPWPAPGDFDIRNMPRTIGAADRKGVSSILPFGFHIVFADGQVWFLSSKIPFETLEKFFTIEGSRTWDREELLGPYALCVTQ